MQKHDPKTFFPHAAFGDISQVTPISLGLSAAAVYAVTTTKGDFILRIHGADRDAWESSVLLQKRAAEHGVAPALVATYPEHKATITVKIAGMPFGFAVSQPRLRHAVFESLVQQLRTLHAIPKDGLQQRNPMDMARRYWQQQTPRPGFPKWFLALGDRLDKAERALAQDRRLVFSHCDLNPANLLWDGNRVWLIDWEVAGLAHPYLDLSIMANFLALSNEAALVLLAGQEQTPLEAGQQETFGILRDFARVVFGTAFVSLIPDLQTVAFAEREETLTLHQCYAQMAAGTLKMSEPQGQAQLAAALFAQCGT